MPAICLLSSLHQVEISLFVEADDVGDHIRDLLRRQQLLVSPCQHREGGVCPSRRRTVLHEKIQGGAGAAELRAQIEGIHKKQELLDKAIKSYRKV